MNFRPKSCFIQVHNQGHVPAGEVRSPHLRNIRDSLSVLQTAKILHLQPFLSSDSQKNAIRYVSDLHVGPETDFWIERR